jgi:hypothetical protein
MTTLESNPPPPAPLDRVRDIARLYAESLVKAINGRDDGTRLDDEQLYEVAQTLRDMNLRLAERRFTYVDAATARVRAFMGETAPPATDR